MTDIAIHVQNLFKRYRIGAREKRANTLRERLADLAASPFDYLRHTLRGPTEEEIIWALKDVSFEVKRGEVVGVPSTSSGQALAATGRGRRKAEGGEGKVGGEKGRWIPFSDVQSPISILHSLFSLSRRRAAPRRRAELVEASTAGWALCWRPALSVTEGWAPASTPN